MEYAALFILLVLCLFFLSRVLTAEIYSFFYKLSRHEGLSTHILALIFFPGVFIHEMSHFIAAKILLVQTGSINLLPRRDGNYVRLGSVAVSESNFVKEFVIGVAPLLSGMTIIIFLVYFLLQDLSSLNFIKIAISLIGIFVISNTMYASRKDFQSALPFLVTLIVLVLVLAILGVRIPSVDLEFISDFDLTRIFHMGSLYLGIPILIDLVIIVVLRIFNRMW